MLNDDEIRQLWEAWTVLTWWDTKLTAILEPRDQATVLPFARG